MQPLSKLRKDPIIVLGGMIVLLTIVVGIGFSFLYMKSELDSQRMSNEVALVRDVVVVEGAQETPTGPVQYTCELSGGTFKNGSCTCPLEMMQTQEMMYDPATGFCQSAHGGPGGDAFDASVGLPWGDYAYYHDVLTYWCEQSGGSRLAGTCDCPQGEIYDKKTGRCE